jgi:methionyl-tRNA synthetase
MNIQLTQPFFSFGNFANRALKFVNSQYDGVLPEGPDLGGPLSPNDETDAEFVTDVNNLIKEYIAAMEAVKLRLGLQTVMHLSARGNLYLQSSGLGKALMTENPARCAQVVNRAVNLIYVLSALIHPFIPETSNALLAQLNAPARAVPEVFSIDLLPGHQVGAPEHLFKRIDEKMADIWRDKFGGASPSAEPDADATHVAPAMSKRKAAAAKKAAAKATAAESDAAPKSAEVLAFEQRVAEQGSLVRELKAKTPKTKEVDDEIAAAVDELKKLKAQLVDMTSNLEN